MTADICPSVCRGPPGRLAHFRLFNSVRLSMLTGFSYLLKI